VSDIYQAFERDLSGWQTRYAGRPDREMLRLCLLALEREQNVAVAYDEHVLGRRLAAMPLPDDVRELIRHALVWVWQDEEMHTIYVRGALLKLGQPLLSARTFLRQTAGAMGGWTVSVRQHRRWSEAPLSRAAATLLTWAGRFTGRVPREVRRHLDYSSFRDFCRYNVDTEGTAWLCWRRLTELAPHVPALSSGQVDDFRRVMEDEDRHRQVFTILADALTDEDELRQGETGESLSARIGAVGKVFLPRPNRRGAGSRNPLGSGAPVFAVQGSSAADKRALFRRLLEDAGLPGLMRERARELGKDVGALRVAVKPSFMLGYSRRDLSVITDPELVEELALFLREQGAADIAVVEGANIYDRFFANRGVREVARYFGFSSPHYRLVDSSGEQVGHAYLRGLAQYTIGRTWKEADLRISFGKMRSHPVELVYLALPNVEGLGARGDQFLFLERQADRATAIMMLLDEFPPHFGLLDGYDWAADGLMGVMACPRPPSPRRLYASADALALDRVAARHLGLRDPCDSPILHAAEQWFGNSGRPPQVVGADEPVPDWRPPYRNQISAALSFLASPVYELGSGRGALIVPEMDREAFPVRGREGAARRWARRAVQRRLGMSLPGTGLPSSCSAPRYADQADPRRGVRP
jgi:uncharacterized protein (DUF362 family)